MSDAQRVTRLQDAFWLIAEELLFYHTNPWELDEALTDWGYDMGPCEAQDLMGLERVLSRQPVRETPILKRMVSEGRMGKIGGVGYYRYPGGGGAVVDPLIEDLILEEAWFAKVTRSELTEVDLVARMNAAVSDAYADWRAEGMTQEYIVALLRRAVHFPEGKDLNSLAFRQ